MSGVRFVQSAPAVDYLFEYSANPLEVLVGGAAETISNASIDAGFFADDDFYVDVVPNWGSSEASNHAIFTESGSDRLFWRASVGKFQWNIGGSGQTVGTATPTFSSGDSLRLVVDRTNNRLRLYVNGVLAGDNNNPSSGLDFSAIDSSDIEVGADGGGSPFDGLIYQPIRGLP